MYHAPLGGVWAGERRQEAWCQAGQLANAEQAKSLWQAPDPEKLRGKRDRGLLAILVACGGTRSPN
jgi:hypothetical protein